MNGKENAGEHSEPHRTQCRAATDAVPCVTASYEGVFPFSDRFFVKSLRFLIPYLLPYRRLLLAAVVWLVLTNALAMVIPWMLKGGIEAVEGGNYRGLAWFALLLALAAVLRGGTRQLSRLRFLRTARRIEVDLRRDLLTRLLGQDAPFFDHHRTGDLLSRFTNDLANIRMLAGFGVLTLANAALVYPGSGKSRPGQRGGGGGDLGAGGDPRR